MSDKNLKEVRCIGENCRKLLAKEYIFRGVIELKCGKCGTVNRISYKTPLKNIDKIENMRKKKGGVI